ncbi:MAG: glucose 1-dehydrogenase [Thaumarchaeota archaeon]|nr:glucose 1-dehydrogenase [Nitrososphaerota archaeon]
MRVNELLNIKGKVAIVTGASSGLGVTFSEALAEEGANLVIAARRIEKLTEVAHNLEKLGIKAVPFQCDVTKQEEVQALIDASVKNFGRIDIIVNNAGVAAMGPSTEMPVEEWNKVVSVNLTGVFLCARTAAKQMIKQGSGKIINIASIYGAVGDIFPAAPYYATKGAVINLTRDLAVEWAPFKINVNAIAPGFFPSEMTEAIFREPRYLEYITKLTPLGRVGHPDDLKGAVLFLSSNASDYITGQTIFVDGGWTIW